METYENKMSIESCIKTIHKQQCTEHKVQSMIDELEMTYDKAKAFDEVKNFTTERLKEQKLTGEYDFGERLICEEIEDIIGGQINGL